MSDSKPGVAEILLYVIGGIGVIWGLWKARIDGFYMSEAPVLFTVLIGAAILLFIGSRVTAARKRAAAADADRKHGIEEPMQTFLAILAFIALIAVLYGVQRLIARGGAVVEGAVTGNTRKRGQDAVHLQLDFTAPVTGPEIIEQIRHTLDLGPKAVNGLKLGGLAEDRSGMLISGAGSRLEFVIDTNPAPSGCTGHATAAKWVESEGRVTTTEAIERIHKHVRAAVEHFGGTCTESVSV